MRLAVAALLLAFTGCTSSLVFNSSQEMKPQQMLDRADLVFIGVIRKQHLESRLIWKPKVPGEDRKWWRVLRRDVDVEFVVRGSESRRQIPVYEIFWTGGASGDWNSTQDDERDLFLVRRETGRYHVVRDWWRSIFPVTTGPHYQLPLDETHPLWERIALMSYRMEPGALFSSPTDPALTLSEWRKVKLLRGLLRHPNPAVRLPACRALIAMAWGQDECWETLPDAERADSITYAATAQLLYNRRRDAARGAAWFWQRYPAERRLLTTHSNPKIRAEACRLWAETYPDDHDNGCPPDQPPPATIVTAQGDVPLVGPWPR